MGKRDVVMGTDQRAILILQINSARTKLEKLYEAQNFSPLVLKQSQELDKLLNDYMVLPTENLSVPRDLVESSNMHCNKRTDSGSPALHVEDKRSDYD